MNSPLRYQTFTVKALRIHDTNRSQYTNPPHSPTIEKLHEYLSLQRSTHIYPSYNSPFNAPWNYTQVVSTKLTTKLPLCLNKALNNILNLPINRSFSVNELRSTSFSSVQGSVAFNLRYAVLQLIYLHKKQLVLVYEYNAFQA